MKEKIKKNRTPIFMTLSAIAATAIITFGVPAAMHQRAVATGAVNNQSGSFSHSSLSIADFPLQKEYDGSPMSFTGGLYYKGALLDSTVYAFTHDTSCCGDEANKSIHKYDLSCSTPNGYEVEATLKYAINAKEVTINAHGVDEIFGDPTPGYIIKDSFLTSCQEDHTELDGPFVFDYIGSDGNVITESFSDEFESEFNITDSLAADGDIYVKVGDAWIDFDNLTEEHAGKVYDICVIPSGMTPAEIGTDAAIRGNYFIKAYEYGKLLIQKKFEKSDGSFVFEDKVYDGKPYSGPTGEGIPEGAKFTYESSNDNTGSGSDVTDVGEYYAILQYTTNSNPETAQTFYIEANGNRITYKEGDEPFAITPAPLTAEVKELVVNDNDTADDISEKVQYEFSGFVEGEDAGVLPADIAVKYFVGGQEVTDPAAAYQAGEYALTLDFGTDPIGNYKVTGVTGAKLIVRAPLPENSITLTAEEKIYDGKAYNGVTGAPENAVIEYFKVDDTPLEGAPTDAGDYKVTVTAADNDTEYYGSVTKEFTISPLPVNISADDKSATAGDEMPELTYTVNTQLPEDVVLPEITLTCDTDMSKAGEFVINISAAEDYNFSMALTPAKLTVIRADVVLDVTAEDKVFDGRAYNGVTGAPENAVFEYSDKNGTALDSAPVNVGEYTVKVSVPQTDATNAAEVTKTFKITPLAVEIAADDKSATAGDKMPALTYTVKTALPADVVLPKITLSCDADMSKAGEYDITIKAAEDSNFTFTLTNATLTVVRADGELTVTAPDKTYDGKAYDKLTFAPSTAEVKYFDKDGNALDSAPVNAGEYTVKAALPQTDSTNAVEVTKTFSITALAAEIAADNKSAKVGGEKPKLTYTVKTALPEGVELPEITLTCNADMSKAGKYDITITAAEDSNFELTLKPAVLTVTAKNNSGGSGGTGGSGGSDINYGGMLPAEPTARRGEIVGWDNIEAAIREMSQGEEIVIELNGNFDVPEKVVEAINKVNIVAYLKVSNVYIWRFDGADMDDRAATPSNCDLNIKVIKEKDILADDLYGKSGTLIEVGDTNIPATLRIWFKTDHVGRTAIAYRYNDDLGRYEVVGNGIVGDNGRVDVDGIGMRAKYAIVLTETVYNLNDFNNDGYIDGQDIIILLKLLVDLDVYVTDGKDYDTDGNGVFNAYDASYLFKILER